MHPSPILQNVSAFGVKPRFNSVKCGSQSWSRTNTMPQNRYLSQGAFDMDILNPQALDTPDGLAAALRAIEAVCHRGDPEITGMVEALNSRPFILEYIISGTLRAPLARCCQY